MIYDQGKEFVGYYFSILKIIEEKEYQLQLKSTIHCNSGEDASSSQ